MRRSPPIAVAAAASPGAGRPRSCACEPIGTFDSRSSSPPTRATPTAVRRRAPRHGHRSRPTAEQHFADLSRACQPAANRRARPALDRAGARLRRQRPPLRRLHRRRRRPAAPKATSTSTRFRPTRAATRAIRAADHHHRPHSSRAEPQRRPAPVRARRPPLHLDRRRRRRRRPAKTPRTSNTLLGKILRIDPAPGRRCRPTRSRPAIPSPAAPGRRRDLGLRPAQPLALLLRPPERRHGDRRRRPGRARGGRLRAEPRPGLRRRRGANYGWNCREGFIAVPGRRPECAAPPPAASPTRSSTTRTPTRRRRPRLLDHRRLRRPRPEPRRPLRPLPLRATSASARSAP